MSVRTMSAVWERSQHSGTELLMLLAIADFADDDGRAYPSVGTLAKKCRMKPRNANYVLRSLQGSGELDIRIGEGPYGTNRYQVRVARLGVQGTAGVQASAGLQPIARPPARDCAKPLQPIADKPSKNHQEPPGDLKSAKKPTLPPCPQDQIRKLYAEILPDLPVIKLWGSSRQTACRTRWVETAKDKGWKTEAEGVEWFRRFFETVSASDFLMGRATPKQGHESWRCDVDFLLSPKGFTGVVEGKYGSATPRVQRDQRFAGAI